MKRSLVIIVAMLTVALFSGNAFAAKSSKSSSGGSAEVDGMLSLASDPTGAFGTTLGIGAGVGFDLSDRLKPSSGKIYGRADINWFKWDASEFGIDVSYTKIPIFLGGRYYVPSSSSDVNVFVEAGLEFSFDKAEVAVPVFFFGGPALKASESALHIGITPGAGIEVPISNDGLFIGGDARYHMITDGYFTLSLVLGKKF